MNWANWPLVVHAAQTHGGTVDKFGGDTTLRIQHNLHTLRDNLRTRGETPLKIGVRINISVELAGAVEIHGKTEPVRVWAIKQAN